MIQFHAGCKGRIRFQPPWS